MILFNKNSHEAGESSEMSNNKDSDYSDFMFWRNLVPLFDKNFPSDSTSRSDENDMESSSSSRETIESKISSESSSSPTNANTATSSTLPTLSNLLNNSSLLETPLNRVSIYSSSNNLSSTGNHYGQMQTATTIEQLSIELKQVELCFIDNES